MKCELDSLMTVATLTVVYATEMLRNLQPNAQLLKLNNTHNKRAIYPDSAFS